jgi:metal-responsive CopG/Arc/MetJ family transcriptional regulator
MKTAISVDDSLMAQADRAAGEIGVSRSKLFSIAMAEYLKKRRNDEITEQLNRAYANDNQAEELAFARAAKRKMAKLVDPW